MLLRVVKIWKLFFLYIFYNLYLKLFYNYSVQTIYFEYPADLNAFSFPFVEGNIFRNILGTIYANVLTDLFWLLPFTIMNIVVFSQLARSNSSESRKLFLNHLNSLILKAYAVWGCIYIIAILVGINQKRDLDLITGDPYAAYGHLALVYFLLGNFTFFNIVLPLLVGFLKKAKLYEDF